MDRLESLSNTLSQLTLYDIKSMYNQAKNVVLNISETEAKVREATNDEPWGASSTLMQEIAQGTFNFQQFNEIMPCIYARFMEKEARQWRQIYKALQLLEYLVKHGSERVVDDARSHISTLKMLRSFHYIDEKGKDEGINVRNRAKELVELLSDVEKIRAERRKAKANRNKYIGVGNDGGYGSGGLSFSSGGSRYGGFGSDSLGGGSSYGNDYYGGGSSSRMGGFSDSGSGRRQYEEYDAGGDEVPSRSSSTVNRSSSLRSQPARKSSAPSPAAAAPPPAPVPNLLDFDDDVPPAPAPAAEVMAVPGLATNKALPKPVNLDDDDFDDFQAAPVQAPPAVPAATPAAAPSPMVAPTGAKPNLMQMLGAAAPLSPTQTQTQQQPQQPSMFGGMGGMGAGVGGMHRATGSIGGAPVLQPVQPVQPQQQGFFGAGTGMGMRPTQPMAMGGASPMLPTPMRANTASPVNTSTQQKKPVSAGGFDDLWNLSLASTGKGTSTGTGGAGQGQGQGKSIKDLEKEKATAGLWGGAQGGNARPGAGMGGGAAFGSFGGAGAGTSSSASGGDDLLL